MNFLCKILGHKEKMVFEYVWDVLPRELGYCARCGEHTTIAHRPSDQRLQELGLEHLITKLREVDMDEKLKCSSCGKEDETVSIRTCGYAADVNNDPNVWHTICDACEHEHIMDI